jgi:hypothetical protein
MRIRRLVTTSIRRTLPYLVMGMGCAGCAVHYFDPKTGTEHLWGFGHLKMRVAPPAEGLQAIVRGTDVVGVSTGVADKQAYLTVGWHRIQRLDIVQESTAFRLEWPNSDFINVRVGSKFPFPTTNPASAPTTQPATRLETQETHP